MSILVANFAWRTMFSTFREGIKPSVSERAINYWGESLRYCPCWFVGKSGAFRKFLNVGVCFGSIQLEGGAWVDGRAANYGLRGRSILIGCINHGVCGACIERHAISDFCFYLAIQAIYIVV